MLKIVNSTVFNVKCDAIVNTVNCDGVMGAGLALEFSLRYPNMFRQYVSDCQNNIVQIGKLKRYIEDNQIIINFPTKKTWKFPSKIEWIQKGLDYFITNYKYLNISSIAFPPLGTANGGLDFENEVKPLMIKMLSNLDVDIYICLDPGYPEGIEKKMLDKIKSDDLTIVCHNLDIKRKQLNILDDSQKKLNRFFEIKDLDGIGIITYKKLFNYYYELSKN